MIAPAVPDDALCLRETNFTVTSVSTLNFVPQPIQEKSHFVQNRIFVGGFPASTSQKEMNDVFCMFGEIIEINIIESDDGFKRYGFVTFRLISSADAVLSHYYNNRGREFSIRGHALNLSRALFKPKKQKGRPTAITMPDSSGPEVVNGQGIVHPSFRNASQGFIARTNERPDMPNVSVGHPIIPTHTQPDAQCFPYQSNISPPPVPNQSIATLPNQSPAGVMSYQPSLIMNQPPMFQPTYNNATPFRLDSSPHPLTAAPISPMQPPLTPIGGVWCCDPNCKF